MYPVPGIFANYPVPWAVINKLISLIFLKNINILKPYVIHNSMSPKMSPKKNNEIPCESCGPSGAYRVEAVLAVDDRGQMVLPKEIREKAGIRPGDKLALISWEKNGSICCLALMKVENLSGMVKDVLDPLIHTTEH